MAEIDDKRGGGCCPYGEMLDVRGKGDEWHTAFYYLAEHIRFLSHGTVNHKELYALVGVDGRYVNHENPLVRKRTAGALSRIVHSKRYMLDMRSLYLQNGLVFRAASHEVCKRILANGDRDAAYLVDCLTGPCWGDVYRGLVHEHDAWRGDADLFRIEWEMHALFSELESGKLDFRAEFPDVAAECELVLGAMFYVLAFGHLDFTFARTLIDCRPTEQLSSPAATGGDVSGSCLIKYSDVERSVVIGSWSVPAGRPFTIGRYTDCDIVETNPGLSRVHCCLYSMGGVWCFEDMGSRNGSIVSRNGGEVFNSKRDGAYMPFALQRGDSIVLAGCSHYWFGALQGDVHHAVVRF